VSILSRNNVKVEGTDDLPALMFSHGFGCDQNMWRFVAPAFRPEYRTVLFDHLGAGASDLTAWSPEKYASLDGYAADIVEIGRTLELQDAVFIGHSVAAMMGLIAAIQAPGMFKSLVLVGPSPSYINEGDYTGGFSREEIGELLASLDENHLGWSLAMAPVIMGAGHDPALTGELANSFCRTDPRIAGSFARTTFLSDCRDILGQVGVPVLILQCSDDIIAPDSVGDFVHARIPGSTLVKMKATGHCPNLSAPLEAIAAIRAFL